MGAVRGMVKVVTGDKYESGIGLLQGQGTSHAPGCYKDKVRVRPLVVT